MTVYTALSSGPVAGIVTGSFAGLVQDALSRLLTNRTCIIIAHRLSTVRHAHEIIVLHEGEIKERGSHEALLRLNGYYKKLVDLQEIQ